MSLLARFSWMSVVVLAAVAVAQKPRKATPDTVYLFVSPSGTDSADGSPQHPLQSLSRAQEAVRQHNQLHDVVVQLADGMYHLSQPLRFNDLDGGQAGHRVSWQALPGALPVLSGGVRVRGWHLYDPARKIYAADVPAGLDSRQLWVNDRLAPMARIELNRKDVTVARAGVTLKGHPELTAKLARETRMELRATGFFTERVAPVERVERDLFTMRQPAWDNNLWGYDTIEKPYHPESAHLYLANALPLLSEPGQWYLDFARHTLYLWPAEGVDLERADVELPTIPVLVSIAGTLDHPVHDLTFGGLRFSHTTWLGPSTAEGYASQQSGSYLTGRAPAYPADPVAACAEGCAAFETMRNEWSQVPASVQVSAANLIAFMGDTFAHLGQYALGIGNDANAMLAGIGLATSDISVDRCTFTDDAGGAILAGGVRRDAHHPPDPRQINRQLAVTNNRIEHVSEDFHDHSAILSTYVEGALILHNDISEVPYDAIDIGYGWGMHDPGGNPNYRVRMHGYDAPANLVYRTPTTHHDVVVASNRVHGAKQFFHDGGDIYNLSASPGTLITENYIYNNSGQIGLYLDEGSRYLTVRRNVVDDPTGEWLNINTVHSALPLRISTDNTATGNWHNSAKTGGLWTDYENDQILDDHLVHGEDWPPEAQSVMRNAGVQPAAGSIGSGEVRTDVAPTLKP